MFELNIIEDIKSHAKFQYPIEACGLVVETANSGTRYIRCENIANDPKKDFKIASDYYMPHLATNRIRAVFHSHTDGSDFPSRRDMIQQMAMGVPWGICVAAGHDCSDPFWFGKGAPMLPLLERPFRHGVSDCFALVKDYLMATVGVALPDLPRDNEWWESGGNILEENFDAMGFVPIEMVEREGDCFLMRLMSPVSNHCGVYLGGSEILHHLSGRPSRIDQFGPWRSRMTRFLRYKF